MLLFLRLRRALHFSVSIVLIAFCADGDGLQSWIEQPQYQEVNPNGNVVIICKVRDKQGECRWEKDGSPVGIYPNKYEWASQPEEGDCSLKIVNATLEYDDGVWQCQVTPGSFASKDALISQGAELVVREAPQEIHIQRVGEEGKEIIDSAGEELELECVVSGGNPPVKIRWFENDDEIQTGHTQENSRISGQSRTWISVSRLNLPVSKSDDGAFIKCLANHPTTPEPMSVQTCITIYYPPTVIIETSPLEYLEEEKDPATLRCMADSNPPSTILWRKEGLNGIFSPDEEINFSPVTRHTAGVYSCTAENPLGMSKLAFIELDVKYSPLILSVGPSRIVAAQRNKKALLNCEAEGNPPPQYQWLQKLPTQEVFIRGHEKTLVIDNVTYNHQGEFVCKVMNTINGEERSVQSEPIRVEVSGAPQVMKYEAHHEVQVQNGEDATLEVLFCADPPPKQAWHLGDLSLGSSTNGNSDIILAAGTGHGRFIAESARKADREDCYVSVLRINGAHPMDSHTYQLKLSNSHGSDVHTIHLVVRDHVSQESLIAVIVGAILTFLLLILICIYCCKSSRRGCGGTSNDNKKNFKASDLESERTDVESTHSSSHGINYPEKTLVIPPDALYGTVNYKESMSHRSHDLISNLDRTLSTSAVFNHSTAPQKHDAMGFYRTEASPVGLFPEISSLQNSAQFLHHHKYHQHQQQHQPTGPPRIVYNDLCNFPKTSNYGSMKKKKNKDQYQCNNVGVSCLVSQSDYPEAHSNSPYGNRYDQP
ncbi:hypothetical protein TCAL_06515 [Tigriopus californicus]|uniref:Ig-like domain-containing protein n=1 Tax=Tigriopus californicus TaxID=6832 RepID=A0A553P4F3_TIGCA|nr:hypothetical protein TCAL_06515 [Tigriopus californicus]